jgi:hypothetical protein
MSISISPSSAVCVDLQERVQSHFRTFHSEEDEKNREHKRRASVCIILRTPPGTKEKEARVEDLEAFYIKRSFNEKDRWSSQVAFPGAYVYECMCMCMCMSGVCVCKRVLVLGVLGIHS